MSSSNGYSGLAFTSLLSQLKLSYHHNHYLQLTKLSKFGNWRQNNANVKHSQLSCFKNKVLINHTVNASSLPDFFLIKRPKDNHDVKQVWFAQKYDFLSMKNFPSYMYMQFYNQFQREILLSSIYVSQVLHLILINIYALNLPQLKNLIQGKLIFHVNLQAKK